MEKNRNLKKKTTGKKHFGNVDNVFYMRTHWIDVAQEAIGHFGRILRVFVEESGQVFFFYINTHF